VRGKVIGFRAAGSCQCPSRNTAEFRWGKSSGQYVAALVNAGPGWLGRVLRRVRGPMEASTP